MADMLLLFSAIRGWLQQFFVVVWDNWLLQIPFILYAIYLLLHLVLKFLPDDGANHD